jgi:hypothetical protein
MTTTTTAKTLTVVDLTSHESHDVDPSTLCVVVRGVVVANDTSIEAPASGEGAVDAGAEHGQSCLLVTIAQWAASYADCPAYVPDPDSRGDGTTTEGLIWWRSSLPEAAASGAHRTVALKDH